ncbi:hypothetical protein [Streptomyces acidicola]|uniref:Uncharacterized protein n=1 Tax=Streptomyces acidicola TaxID=2596892 RepID=A0A5N8WLI1_9ACTN|nr:hypothetical protein [Streptomyces acidicola]MPY47368.1 hypothetical protein [Streptomyces acidicola]
MSDEAEKTSRDRAMDVVRGYADHDAIAVQDALAGLDAGNWIKVYAVLSGLLRSTISIMELTGERWKLDHLVRHADEVAAAAPPHYEFTVAEAARAWARGDQSALRTLSGRDLAGAVHMTAVFLAVLGLALWGRDGFLDVLRAFHETVTALVNDQPLGIRPLAP